ncbi:hypothetical protein XENOCAPTIV_018325 [Xenoophorus captivus]|uniref:Agouti signaling protein n=1 Tax=Xenoophorus captivus TaxID=1517983 RepID=A0ABV0R4E7_9TELE
MYRLFLFLNPNFFLNLPNISSPPSRCKQKSVVTPRLFFLFSCSNSFVSIFLLNFPSSNSASSFVSIPAPSPPDLVPLYNGNTRKPEKVENFHPPIRFPLSSLR